MKSLVVILLILGFSGTGAFASSLRKPISFDDVLNKSIDEKKSALNKVSHLIDRASGKKNSKTAKASKKEYFYKRAQSSK